VITDAMIDRMRSFAFVTLGVKFDLVELQGDGFKYRFPTLTWRQKDGKTVIAMPGTLERAERFIKQARRGTQGGP
jgi:hypothetical protein